MLQNLQVIPKLAGYQENRAVNLLLVSVGSSCIFSIRNGGHQEKNWEEVSLIFIAPLYRNVTNLVFNDEQSNTGRCHDLDCTWHERYSDRRRQGLLGNHLRKKEYQHHYLCRSVNSLDFLQNFCIPILFACKCLCKRTTSHRRMVHYQLLVWISSVHGFGPLPNASLLDLLLNDSRS